MYIFYNLLKQFLELKEVMTRMNSKNSREKGKKN